MKLTNMIQWHREVKSRVFRMDVNYYYFLILGGY